jgi:abhydrolase domain-containing protein 6
MQFPVLIILGTMTLLALFAWCMNRFSPLVAANFLRKRMRNKAGLVERCLVANGQKFPYLTGGSGAPLLLLHGFTANKDTFNALSRYLTPHYTVYTPDWPGFGDSSRDPKANYSSDAQVEHLHNFVTVLGLHKFHLIGSSMGGAFAALFTVKYAELVESLCLICAAGTQEFSDSLLMQKFRQTGLFPHLIKDPKDHGKKWKALFATPLRIPYCADYAMGVAAARDYELHKNILTALTEEASLEDRCGVSPTPTLIMTGDKDAIVPPESVHSLATSFPMSTVKIMTNVGHIPMVEVPLTTAEEYLAFRANLHQSQQRQQLALN